MSGPKKTLVVLTPAFPENEQDINWLPFLQALIKAFNERSPGLEVIILSFQFPLIKGRYKWHGNEVISFGGNNKGRLHRPLLWLKVWRELVGLKKQKNIIGLFSLWHTECALLGHHFGKLYQLPHRNWLCGQEVKAGNKYSRYIRADAMELIAMSDFLQREFYANYGVKPAHIIPVGVEPSNFNAVGQQRSIDVLGVGSLIPLKQYNVFVDVVGALAAQLPGLKSMICGGGPEMVNLQQQVGRLGIEGSVTLAGETPNTEVLALMQRARVFLHTSSYEGFGTVCLEALCAGAHVVSFTRPMDRDISHWHHVADKEAMVLKVQELLADTNLSHSPVCPFTVKDIAGSILGLFDN